MEAREADEIIVQDKKEKYYPIIVKIVNSFLKNPFKYIAIGGTAIILLLFLIVAIGTVLK